MAPGSEIIEKLFMLLADVPDNSYLLDVGCNSGEMMRMFEEVNGCKVCGIDLSKPLIKKAKAKGLYAKVADAQDIPFADNTFDCVLMTEVLLFIPKPKLAFREIKRVLKPGGIFIGSTVDGPLMSRKKKHYGEDDETFASKPYSERKLKKLLSGFFDNISIRRLILAYPWLIFKGFKGVPANA